VVIAANKGIKTQIARELEAGDEYIELDRVDPSPQWAKMKEDYKHGFDVVVRTFPTFIFRPSIQ
jgi:D-arabinitol dehydrogenase (NADP+)